MGVQEEMRDIESDNQCIGRNFLIKGTIVGLLMIQAMLLTHMSF